MSHQAEEVERVNLEEIQSHISEFKMKIKAANKKQLQNIKRSRATHELRRLIEIENEEYFYENQEEPDYLDDNDQK